MFLIAPLLTREKTDCHRNGEKKSNNAKNRGPLPGSSVDSGEERPLFLLDREVFGLWMMHDKGTCRLLGNHLEIVTL